MIVYRIARLEYARDISGRGGELYAGRWHYRGTPVVYAASSRALAVAEKLVHQPVDLIPPDLVLVDIEIAGIDGSSIPTLTRCPGWNALPATTASRDIGDEWLQSCSGLVARVPSVVVHGDWNILINPRHPDIRKVTIAGMHPCLFDERLVSLPNER